MLGTRTPALKKTERGLVCFDSGRNGLLIQGRYDNLLQKSVFGVEANGRGRRVPHVLLSTRVLCTWEEHSSVLTVMDTAHSRATPEPARVARDPQQARHGQTPAGRCNVCSTRTVQHLTTRTAWTKNFSHAAARSHCVVSNRICHKARRQLCHERMERGMGTWDCSCRGC